MGEWAGVCLFAHHRPNQPHKTGVAAVAVREPNGLRVRTEVGGAKHCVDARNHVPWNQPRARGSHQPERLTMSTQTFQSSADTLGLDVDDTTSVARAFALIGASCITFAIIAGATIASIA